MNGAREYAEKTKGLWLLSGHARAARAWAGFLALGVSFNGVDWDLSRKLARKYKSVPRECFANARRIAERRREYSYCEGFAVNLVATEHAWLVDSAGRVLDPTWCLLENDPMPTDYFGMLLTLAEVYAARDRNPFGPAWMALASAAKKP